MAETDRPEAFALTYDRWVAERDRIRAARAFFARQLGPLPAAAGISVAAVGAFAHKVEHWWAMVGALVAFFLMTLASVLYSRMPPYRELRAARLKAKRGLSEGEGIQAPRDWYAAEIELEGEIYSAERVKTGPWWFPRRDPGAGLEAQLDRERFGVFVVQWLFLVVVLFLVLSRWSA